MVKLAKLVHKIKEKKIFKINRKLTWKQYNYDKNDAKGFRKSKINK